MSLFYAAEGIVHQKTCVYTPQQNGVIEKKHQHILNVSKALKYQSSLPLSYWVYCLKHATTLISITHSPLPKNKTLFELPYSTKPNYSNLKVFGCLFQISPRRR